MMTTDVMSKTPYNDDFYNWNSLHFPDYITVPSEIINYSSFLGCKVIKI